VSRSEIVPPFSICSDGQALGPEFEAALATHISDMTSLARLETVATFLAAPAIPARLNAPGSRLQIEIGM